MIASVVTIVFVYVSICGSKLNISVTKVENHARYYATLVANELIQINVFVSEPGYFEVWCGYLWISGLVDYVDHPKESLIMMDKG